MRPRFYLKFSCLLLTGLILLNGVAFGQVGSIDLRVQTRTLKTIRAGMSMPQVIFALGPAAEKMRYAISGRELWSYLAGSVMFRRGVVADVKLSQPLEAQVAAQSDVCRVPKKPEQKVAHKNPKILSPLDAKQTAKVFSEMMQEIPGEESGGSAINEQRMNEMRPGMIRPVVPQPVPLDDEDE